ncbi:putative leader peptide [Umezawaea endophytica]|uniref:putative leader peptide n=1 Tax=Umezawaea endophytica TaxID=1654476 RepID=UPI0035585FF1
MTGSAPPNAIASPFIVTVRRNVADLLHMIRLPHHFHRSHILSRPHRPLAGPRRGASIGAMSQAAALSTRRHVDLRRQASAICAAPGRPA